MFEVFGEEKVNDAAPCLHWETDEALARLGILCEGCHSSTKSAPIHLITRTANSFIHQHFPRHPGEMPFFALTRLCKSGQTISFGAPKAIAKGPKREYGEDDPKGAETVTAPATVSGEVLKLMPLGNREGALRPSTRKSGDLPDE